MLREAALTDHCSSKFGFDGVVSLDVTTQFPKIKKKYILLYLVAGGLGTRCYKIHLVCLLRLS